MTEAQRRNAALGKMQREKIAEEQRAKQAADVGSYTFAEFKEQLTRKYGNLLRAWKLGLDSDGSGKISFVEFCNAARAEGFAGNLKACWKEMDQDGEGFIEMREFAPDIDALMTSFIKCLKDSHAGSLIKAWKQSLDTDKSGRVQLEELVESMRKLQWDGDAARVYRLLDFDRSG